MILYKKLNDISQNSHHSFLKAIKPKFKTKKSQKDNVIINGIKTLAQENLFILKRLLTQESDYSAEKMRQKYKQTQKYKNNICHYPSINFNKTKKETKPLIQTFELSPKKHSLPKINRSWKRNFMTFQKKYMKKELDSLYFRDIKKINKNNTVTNTRSHTKKNTMNIATENEDESLNINKKLKDDENSGSNQGSQNEDDEEEENSRSGSGSSSGDKE